MSSRQEVKEVSMMSEYQGEKPGSANVNEQNVIWAKSLAILAKKRGQGFLSMVGRHRDEPCDQPKPLPEQYGATKIKARRSSTHQIILEINDTGGLSLGKEHEHETDFVAGKKTGDTNLLNKNLQFELYKAKKDLERSKAELQELRKHSRCLEKENGFLTFRNQQLCQIQQLFQRSLLNSFLNEPYPLDHFPFLCAMDGQINEGPFSAGEYDLLETVGGGGIGTVYLARNSREEEYAIKKIGKGHLDTYDKIEQLHLEVRALSDNRHPNIISLKETFHGRTAFYLVFDKAWMDVHSYVELGDMSVPILREIMIGLFQALGFIHERSYAHLDLKPDNILLTFPGEKGKITADNVRLCDFGLCVHGGGSRQGTILQEGGILIGTKNFFAPELGVSCTYDAALADMWSSGATLLEITNGGFVPTWVNAYDLALGNERDHGSLFERLIYNYLDQKRSKIGPQSPMDDLMMNGLLVRPDERYRSSEVLNHPWFSGRSRRCCV